MTQAFEACGEASRGMTSDAGQLEHGARGVPPFALHGTLCLAALLVLAACGPSQPSSPTRNVSTGAETVPDFAGAAEPIASLSSCPHILSPDLRNPFNAGPSSTSIADYKLLGCWQGTLDHLDICSRPIANEGLDFVLVLFQSDANKLSAGMGACLGKELLQGSLDRTL